MDENNYKEKLMFLVLFPYIIEFLQESLNSITEYGASENPKKWKKIKKLVEEYKQLQIFFGIFQINKNIMKILPI